MRGTEGRQLMLIETRTLYVTTVLALMSTPGPSQLLMPAAPLCLLVSLIVWCALQQGLVLDRIGQRDILTFCPPFVPPRHVTGA